MKRMEAYTENLIHSLTVYRFNLLKLVKFRQNNIAILYIKYHKSMPKEIQSLCAQIIESDINYYNMNLIELEIEGVHHLVRTTVNSRDKVEQDFDNLLYLSEREYNSITQAYYSFYSHGSKTLNRAP
ncbi:hypothetical protein FACS1894166_08960 [Bacilli bacterium]|nr:hypothetical protein FACS1894166_08960 [Bacilli bacterium]